MAGAVGAGFFDVVRTPPALGRVFLAEEDSPAKSHVVVLSDGFWKTHIGGAPDAVGRTLTLDGEAYTIVGVMPARFSSAVVGHREPRHVGADRLHRHGARGARQSQRLGGRAAEAGRQHRSRRSRRWTRSRSGSSSEYPQANAGWGATVVPLQELIVGDVRTSLVMLLAAVALVLLIACANVGNLLFARALGAAQGARDPRGARRRPRARLPAAADRSAGARGGRRRRRPAAGAHGR